MNQTNSAGKSKITVFNKIKEVDTPFFKDIDEVLNDIKSEVCKDAIAKVRAAKDKDHKNKLKLKLLKVYCFSGEFSKRRAINIVNHSGFACLDFDEYDSFNDAVEIREALRDNEYIYSAFISPGGKGVKALVKVPKEINHYKKYYEALCETFKSNIDAKTKDISRACYESSDADLWINKDSKVWVLKKEYTEITRTNKYPDYFKINDQSKKVDVITSWFNKKFTLNVGERNNNLFIFACGLNKAGLNKDDAIGLFVNYYSNGVKEEELMSIINSAYKNTSEFDSLTLIDDNKINQARELLKKGNKSAKRKLKKEGLDEDQIEDIIEFDFEEDFLIFWNTDKNGKITLNDFKFKLFLENRGFFKVNLNDKEFTFVKVYNNIIEEISPVRIKDFVLEYVEPIDINLYNYFARSTSKFSDVYLNQLSTRDLTMLRDTSKESYLMFQNCILKITKDSIDEIKYINCGGLVWKKNIIPHNYKKNTLKSDFEQFMSNISNNDADRKKMLECSIGYLLNTHKKEDEGVAIILYDETLNDNPSGRTGKTLISKGLQQLRKSTTLNGKSFNGKGQFPYDIVNLDDNILVFDDLERTFKFDSLFSIITGDLTLNKKNLQPIVIPYEISPKILFTSNYVLSGTGDSHDARKVEIELFRHYSAKYKPIDEFGKRFWGDWSSEEYDSFFCYMISNIQKYFKYGLIKSELKTGKVRKLISNTNDDFFDFCENEFYWKEDKYYTTKEVYDSYKQQDRELPKNMNSRWFGRWLSSYFEYKAWKREDINTGGIRKFKITGLETKKESINEESEVPF